MFVLKSNKEIGEYLKDRILSRYPSCRRFCAAYIDLSDGRKNDVRDSDDDEIRKLQNRLSQILKGKKGIQTYDLPIFSELLGISCEQILSAGKSYTPVTSRRTNYDIAHSKNKADWVEYVNRGDRVASYADEFGKTIVDYAIEANNYPFIRFLIDEGYITFISDDAPSSEFNYGASTRLKPRPFEDNTLSGELRDSKSLRTKIIALALEANDCSVLCEMRAREVPPQMSATFTSIERISFSDYCNESLINAVLRSDAETIHYFCEEYSVKSKWQDEDFTWIFPFIDRLISEALKRNSKHTAMLLDAAVEHNKKTLNVLLGLLSVFLIHNVK